MQTDVIRVYGNGMMNFLVHRWKWRAVLFFSVKRIMIGEGVECGGRHLPVHRWGEKRRGEGGTSSPHSLNWGEARTISFSLCHILFLHRVTSKGKSTTRRTRCHWRAAFHPRTQREVCTPPPPPLPIVSCQEINMWHRITGGRRRHVGHEAKINK